MRRTRYAWLAGSVLAASCSLAGSGWAAGKFEFDAQAKTLLVTTSALELKVEGGAVVALKNRRTGETLSSGIPWSELEKASAGAVCAEPREAGKPARQPIARKPLASSPVAFQHVSKSEGVLTYTGLSNGPAEDELRIGLRLEEGGELSFRVELRLSDPRLVVREVCLPFVGLKPEAVILGSGERFARNDEPFSGRCMRVANNLYSPPLAVIEGKKGVIGMWPEAPSFGYDDMVVNHKPEADEVVPQVALAFDARDPETASEPGVTRSSWWRLAALPSWLDVAKRYRAYLEKKTAAKPLWQHDPAWVRDIHAVYMERPNTAERAKSDQFYADLAAKFDPKKLLLFYWNGNCILLFADHRYMTNFGYPKPQEIAALRRHGFRWIGYHPYVLLMSPKGKELHLAETRQRGFGVPDDYTFQPDYDGPPEVEKFYDFFRPVSVGYYASLDESKKLWTLHPGTKKARDYLARNFGNYCRTHEMSGAYLDILGADHAGQCLTNAPEDRRIMEGNDWRRGEELACRAMKQANPNLALMSEVQGEWTTTHTFYTWEGQSHLTHPRPVRLNHPLRAACWGSYTWTRFDPHTGAPEALALMAGLPPVNLADDWSIARAKLYMDEELFHDLPDKWDSDALAYFRAKGGRWFQYRRMPWGYAYVEQGFLGQKVRLGRLVKQSEFPLKPPARIQGWIAYRDGKPIGLNPARSYNFLSEPSQPDGKLQITDLSDGAFISAIRHSDSHSVIELGSASSGTSGRMKVVFHEKCLGVVDPATDRLVPFEKGASAEFTTPLPGGLVFQWREPKTADSRFTASFVRASGHVHANGIPYAYWTFNSGIRSGQITLTSGAPTVPAVEIGTGLHRGYTEQWFDLVAGAKPVLRFDVGYPLPQDKRQRPLAFSVRVNGKEVWREMVKADPSWRPREAPLAEFAGRRVLVTLSAEEVSDENAHPSHTVMPARFGRVRITDNPLPEVKPDGADLSAVRRMLFADSFDGHVLASGWTVEMSPAHGEAGRIAPEGGKLAFTGQHYKYQYVSRPWPSEGDTVQARAEVRLTGCAPRWNPGIGLWWGPGRWAFTSLHGGRFVAELAGSGSRDFPLALTEQPVYEELFCGWLRMSLTADKVLFSFSADGKTWTPKAEFPRGPKYADPPQLLLLGRGAGGPNDAFKNDERWAASVTTCYLDELVVGRDSP